MQIHLVSVIIKKAMNESSLEIRLKSFSEPLVPVCFICGRRFEISEICGILCKEGKESGCVCLECIEAGKEGFQTRIELHLEKVKTDAHRNAIKVLAQENIAYPSKTEIRAYKKELRKEIKSWKEKVGNNKDIIISKKLRIIPPVYTDIVGNLIKIDVIKFVKVTPDFLAASNEVKGGSRDPVAKPHHPTAIGISLIVDLCCKTIQFYEINSAIKGYGHKMVSAVLKDLPKDWKVILFMDWSDGFWDKMKEKFKDVKWVDV
ncbi:hypothetical protein ES703_38483 [subsurface metagenome]